MAAITETQEKTPGDDNRTAAIVLAAGKSSRMKSKLPKTLHSICGKPLLVHILDALAQAGAVRRVVVVGHEAEKVMDCVDERLGAGVVEYVIQTEQKGTGHAAQMAQPKLSGPNAPQTILVAAGDAPLVSADVFRALLQTHRESGASATLLSAVVPDAGSYGRIVRDANGNVLAIVEAKDATPNERDIREINAGVYAFQTVALFPALDKLRPANAQNELYLTDVIGLLQKAGHKVGAFVSPDSDVVLGVNTRVELADVGQKMRRSILRDLMLSGVTITDPDTTYVDAGVVVGQDTMLLPNTHLLGDTTIGEDCVLGPNANIVNAVIGNKVRARACFIEQAHVGDGCKIGPFAHLRPGSVLDRNVRIGNFVETKATHLNEGVAVGHLSYLGDADVGAHTNIGAGTITCNYDGEKKSRTRIGADVFVGSHTAFVAPVVVGDGAATAAGSVITRDLPPGSLGIARQRQTVKEGWADNRRKKRPVTLQNDGEHPLPTMPPRPEGNPMP